MKNPVCDGPYHQLAARHCETTPNYVARQDVVNKCEQASGNQL